MGRVDSHNQPASSRWNWLYKVSGIAALATGAIFLLAIVSLVITGLRHSSTDTLFSQLQENWLVVLFKLNAGLDGVQFDRLTGLNTLDLILMLLVAALLLGLYAALRQAARFWSLIAALLPFLGIVLFMITKMAGRSGVMGAGLVISIVMLRSSIFARGIALLGILACVLLLAADIGTAEDSQSFFIAFLISVGYVLLMVWFFLTGGRLLQLMPDGLEK